MQHGMIVDSFNGNYTPEASILGFQWSGGVQKSHKIIKIILQAFI